jgi:hemerythrin-like domain-containing protein
MNALASLIHEHRVISRLIQALEVYANCLRLDWQVEPVDLVGFARAFREFADELHHEKEEGILLPILARNGLAWEDGVLPEVRRDHRHERYLIDVLCHAAARQGSWSNEDRRVISATALALVEFQREHLHMENTKLFPEVPKRLGPEVLEQLATALARFDADARRSARNEDLDQVIEQLILRYAPAAPAANGVGGQLDAAADGVTRA